MNIFRLSTDLEPIMAKTKTTAEVIDMNALRNRKNKTKPLKDDLFDDVTVTPITQEITSLFSMTPEALRSIAARWRESAGVKSIGYAKAKLLKCNPSPALVRSILDGACDAHSDSGFGYIDQRVFYTELAKGINDEALTKAIDACNLNMSKLDFTYDDGGETVYGKMSAMWVLHPVFGEHVLTIASRRYMGFDAGCARHRAMVSMLTREPNRLIDAVLAGRVGKKALTDLKKLKAGTDRRLNLRSSLSTTWTKIELVRATVWPCEMLKSLARDTDTRHVSLFGDSQQTDTRLHWWPTRTTNSSSVYEEAVGGKMLSYFDLMLVASMGAFFDMTEEDGEEKVNADILDGLLSKLPNANKLGDSWRAILTLAYRHEHMERIVHHLATSWKGFAEAVLSDEAVDWLVDMLPRLRGRLPSVNNRATKANRQGKAARLAIMLRVIQGVRPDLPIKASNERLTKWVKTGSTAQDPAVVDVATAKQFFLPKAAGSKLVTEDMVALAVSLKADPVAARTMLPTIDTDVLRGLLVHANTDFVMYLYALDPMLVWAVEYKRAFDARSKQTRDRIRKLLPKWLIGVTDEQDVRDTDW